MKNTLIKKFSTVLISLSERPLLTLMIIIGISLAIRFVLLPVRWINPDEGAHLMDARLMLEGYAPIVDFGSRQPFYVLVLAAFLKLFGVSYKIGRLMPLFSNIATGCVMYFIGVKLFNKKVGLLSSILFLFLPLVLAWSTVVKTEPLAVFLASMSVYLVINSQVGEIRHLGWLIFAGIFAGLAYFVRQPSIAVSTAIALFLIFHNLKQPKIAMSGMLFFVTGFMATCLTVWVFYIGKMPFNELFLSQLNPLNVIMSRVLHMLNMLPETQRIVDTQGFRILDQEMSQTITIWRQTFFSVAFIIFGAVGHLVWILRSRRKILLRYEDSLAWCLLGFWGMVVVLIYVFQSLNRGFFSQYFVEVLPPLCIMTAAFLYRMFKNLKTEIKGIGVILIAGIVFYLIFLSQHLLWRLFPGIGFYVFFAPLLVTLIAILVFSLWESKAALILAVLAGAVLSTFAYTLVKIAGSSSFWAFIVSAFVLTTSLVGSRRRWAATVSHHWLSVAALILMGTFSVVTAGYSGWLIGPKYDSVWSPKTVSIITKVLKSNADLEDVVLSGGMIWQFEAGLRTFFDVPHPTEFLKKRYQDFENEFGQQRPRFVIEDGYTHRKYRRHSDFLTAELDSNYDKIVDMADSRYPVRVYKLRDPQLRDEGITGEYASFE